ncbi:MAG: hypothetical protein DDT26_00829 [Dehalococcoidia bacterium]|nr:hypothetical protein [Chloroflexota bacterium]
MAFTPWLPPKRLARMATRNQVDMNSFGRTKDQRLKIPTGYGGFEHNGKTYRAGTGLDNAGFDAWLASPEHGDRYARENHPDLYGAAPEPEYEPGGAITHYDHGGRDDLAAIGSAAQLAIATI